MHRDSCRPYATCCRACARQPTERGQTPLIIDKSESAKWWHGRWSLQSRGSKRYPLSATYKAPLQHAHQAPRRHQTQLTALGQAQSSGTVRSLETDSLPETPPSPGRGYVARHASQRPRVSPAPLTIASRCYSGPVEHGAHDVGQLGVAWFVAQRPVPRSSGPLRRPDSLDIGIAFTRALNWRDPAKQGSSERST